MTRPALIDVSHVVEHGMVTYKGLPPPVISDHLTREASRQHYEAGTEFHIGRIDLVANTGTYMDAPFHRHPDREDLAGLDLERLAGLPGIVLEASQDAAPVTIEASRQDVGGLAVLIRSGWDARWGTDAYWDPDPWLSPETLDVLVEGGAAVVGVDWTNVDDTNDPPRPAHTLLLGAGIPIVEHLRGLDALPPSGFRFWAVPPRIVRGASFPVRAFAEIP